MPPQKSVLITGCSDGGLGSALALAFHASGLKVYATGRNLSKLTLMKTAGIEILTLDVLSASSISACVSQLNHLDILVNNAGAGYGSPISDLSIPAAKELFDLNVWSYLAVTQAFLPLLLQSRGMIVNNTSAAANAVQPFHSTYNASKIAMSMFSEHQRFELAPFGIRVVELKTGAVQSNFITTNHVVQAKIPEKSIYAPVRDLVEKAMLVEGIADGAPSAETWANAVVKDLLKTSPPIKVWRGQNAGLAKLAQIFPQWLFDAIIMRMTGMDGVAKAIRSRQ